uniref:Uncharacterized protein n=1 Tax=Ralstonia solanacearum CFBP2957 TaxID=859656 RepID=D8P327_RALSL|nr:exported protein of unknown function [Ralstonia solanacearum CFBP2957]
MRRSALTLAGWPTGWASGSAFVGQRINTDPVEHSCTERLPPLIKHPDDEINALTGRTGSTGAPAIVARARAWSSFRATVTEMRRPQGATGWVGGTHCVPCTLGGLYNRFPSAEGGLIRAITGVRYGRHRSRCLASTRWSCCRLGARFDTHYVCSVYDCANKQREPDQTTPGRWLAIGARRRFESPIQAPNETR